MLRCFQEEKKIDNSLGDEKSSRWNQIKHWSDIKLMGISDHFDPSDNLLPSIKNLVEPRLSGLIQTQHITTI